MVGDRKMFKGAYHRIINQTLAGNRYCSNMDTTF